MNIGNTKTQCPGKIGPAWYASLHHTARKSTAVSSSTPKYRNGIGALQFRHLPRCTVQVMSGTLDVQGIWYLQIGQNDRFGSFTDISSGSR